MTGDAVVRFGGTAFQRALEERFDRDSGEVLDLSARMCAIQGVSVPADQSAFRRLNQTCRLVREFAESRGLRVLHLEPDPDHPFPFVIVTFREHDLAAAGFDEAVALIGHLDVAPSKHGGQFSPLLRGVDLYARGAADMKTVVATWLVWMARLQQQSGPKPPFVLLLSTCEENGSHRPHHVRSVLELLQRDYGLTVRFGLVGARTGELEWMGTDLAVGPVCTENRSWHWYRFAGSGAPGLQALERVAMVVKRWRGMLAELNLRTAGSDRARRQPGMRSGFIVPFASVAGVPGVEHLENAVTVRAMREGGRTFHSASADATISSLLERLAGLAAAAGSVFGRERVHLAGLRIGEEGNFNTWDGAGALQLVLSGVGLDEARAWSAGIDEVDIQVTVRQGSAVRLESATAVDIDMRELLDHHEAMKRHLDQLRAELGEGESLELVKYVPPWRCPADQPDLVRLLEAYEGVVGEPSPDFVKLHGNDGGNMVAWQHAADRELAARNEGCAVIFGQVGMDPHGSKEFHRGTSIRPYLDILDRWAASYR